MLACSCGLGSIYAAKSHEGRGAIVVEGIGADDVYVGACTTYPTGSADTVYAYVRSVGAETWP